MIKAGNVYIENNGCLRRRLDCVRISKYFERNGYVIVDDPEKADYIFFISCAVLRSKEYESFAIIEKLSKHPARLIVAGCLPVIAKEKLMRLMKGDFVTTKDLDKLDFIFKDSQISFSEIPDANLLSSDSIKVYSPFRAALPPAFLRVGYGCNSNCSYCSARLAIGRLKSKLLDVCLSEYRKLIEEGYRYFVILADDVGAYGLDINSSLPDLLENMLLLEVGLEVDWEIHELHPRWAIKYKNELVGIMKKKRIIRITCPIQSADDRILHLMNRGHNSRDIEVALSAFKKTAPYLSLNTHIIIGFPSETDNEFITTLKFIKRVKFDFVTFIAYSDQDKTAAYQLTNKIDVRTITKRKKMASRFLQGIVKFKIAA